MVCKAIIKKGKRRKILDVRMLDKDMGKHATALKKHLHKIIL